jgi:hypothetical protein
MSRAAATAFVLLTLSAPAARPAEILIHDAKSSPESLTMTPDGNLFAGSASSPYIYLVKKGATTAETFVDAKVPKLFPQNGARRHPSIKVRTIARLLPALNEHLNALSRCPLSGE